MSVLEIITNELARQGKTQKSLMDYLGLSRNVFTEWKGGRNVSYERHLPRIADFLGVSVDALLGRETKKTAAPGEGSAEERTVAEIVQRYLVAKGILRDTEELNPRRLEYLGEMMDGIAKAALQQFSDQRLHDADDNG